MRRKWLMAVPAGILLAGLTMSGCGTATPVNSTSTVSSSATASNAHDAYLYMVVLTGKMLQKPGWPAIYPADFTVPANSDVTVIVRNYDNGTAPVSAMYGKVTGTVNGNEQVNGHTVTSIASTEVSHTITVSSLNLNIPIPPATSSGPSIVVFSFHTPATPGHYTWLCMAPCGPGAMATDGWMRGTMTVA